MSNNWIAVDWGTTNLRCWFIDRNNNILDKRYTNCGGGSLSADQFENVLLNTVGDWLNTNQPTKVIACGMLGSREGWQEVPYATIPGKPSNHLTSIETTDQRLSVYICAGMAQSDPAAIMRGEETQVAGFIAKNPEYEGALCLPGTHSKWVMIKSSEIIQLESIMTGELYSLIGKQSILNKTLDTKNWSNDTFDATIQELSKRENILLPELFRIRSTALLDGQVIGNSSRLSALLIGSEILSAQEFWLQNPVRVIGADHLSSLYARALALLGAKVSTVEADNLTLIGLIQNHQLIERPIYETA